MQEKQKKTLEMMFMNWSRTKVSFTLPSTFLVFDFFFFSDDGWFGWAEVPSMEEAILGLEAEEAREARAR